MAKHFETAADRQFEKCGLKKIIDDTIWHLNDKNVNQLLTEKEINLIYPNFAGAFKTKEKFRRAKFAEIFAVNIAKANLIHDHATNVALASSAISKLMKSNLENIDDNAQPVIMLNGVEADV